MRQHAVNQLIHGHTHRPGRYETATGLRWVLGDWAERGWALGVKEGVFSLYNFQIIQ